MENFNLEIEKADQKGQQGRMLAYAIGIENRAMQKMIDEAKEEEEDAV